MNSTIDSNDLAQSSKTTFNISDYVNFDFDIEAPCPSVGVSSDTSVVEPLHGMSIEDPDFGFVDALDTEFAGIFQLSDGSNALGDDFNTSPRCSENSGIPNTFEAPITAADGFSITTAMNHVPEDLGITENLQTTTETDSPLEDFNISERTSSFDGVDPTALVMPRSPSRWVPLPIPLSANLQAPTSLHVMREAAPLTPETQREPSRWGLACPRLQQHLNSVYAAEIISLRSNPNPAPVLYFPAGRQLGSPVPVGSFPPRSVPAQYGTSQLRTGIPMINPSLMQETHLTLTSIKKRALDADESNSEPALKRTKTSQAEEASVNKDDESDDDDEPVTRRTRPIRKNLSPTVAKDDDSQDDSIDGPDDTDSSDLSSPISPPTRTRRGMQGNRPHTSGPHAKGKSPNRKMQKLLEEIQDTDEYAVVQGYETESEGSQDSVPGRSVRRGARKSYVGQE